MAIANIITSSAVRVLCSHVETVPECQVSNNLRARWDQVVLRRRTGKSTCERWYRGDTTRTKTPSRTRVRIFQVIEEGRVEKVPVSSPALGPPGPSNIRACPAKRKRKNTRSRVKLPRIFEIVGPPIAPQKQSLVGYPSFGAALESQLPHSGSRKAGGIDVPKLFSRWECHRDHLHHYWFVCFRHSLNCVPIVFLSYFQTAFFVAIFHRLLYFNCINGFSRVWIRS